LWSNPCTKHPTPLIERLCRANAFAGVGKSFDELSEMKKLDKDADRGKFSGHRSCAYSYNLF
jgi:hypothetical protein